jgi:hypothetical protein
VKRIALLKRYVVLNSARDFYVGTKNERQVQLPAGMHCVDREYIGGWANDNSLYVDEWVRAQLSDIWVESVLVQDTWRERMFVWSTPLSGAAPVDTAGVRMTLCGLVMHLDPRWKPVDVQAPTNEETLYAIRWMMANLDGIQFGNGYAWVGWKHLYGLRRKTVVDGEVTVEFRWYVDGTGLHVALDYWNLDDQGVRRGEDSFVTWSDSGWSVWDGSNNGSFVWPFNGVRFYTLAPDRWNDPLDVDPWSDAAWEAARRVRGRVVTG